MRMPYMGRILWVDLTRGTLHTENIPATFYARQLSGLGLAIGQLLDRICVDACPVACLAIVHTQDVAERRARPMLAQARDCIACRFCAIECPAEAITMKPPSQMTEAEKSAMTAAVEGSSLAL